MGERLKALFALANARGGLAWTSQLALRTCVTTRTAELVEDTPELVARVEAICEELVSQKGRSVRPPAPAPKPVVRNGASRLRRYFDFAKEQGGIPLAVKLAAKTCITSAMLETLPDTEENIAKVRATLRALLPATSIPEF